MPQNNTNDFTKKVFLKKDWRNGAYIDFWRRKCEKNINGVFVFETHGMGCICGWKNNID